MSKTKFIAIEGIDGSGKTTTVNTLKNELEKEGWKVGVIKNLTPDTILSKAVREWIAHPAEGLVYPSDLIASVFTTAIMETNHILDSMLKSDEYDYIITDRWLLSTAVYAPNQNIFLKDISLTEENIKAKKIIELIASIIHVPDYLFIIDIHPNEAIRRVLGRDAKMSLDYFTNEVKIKEYSARYKTYIENYDRIYGENLTVYSNGDDVISGVRR